MDYKVNFVIMNAQYAVMFVHPCNQIPHCGAEENYAVGKTTFIKENCIVETEGTACGACSEHCLRKRLLWLIIKEN